MPEAPEICFACKFINRVCANQIFSGKVEKSDVSKNPDVAWDCKAYTISSKSRGKELMLNLRSTDHKGSGEEEQKIDILVHFGMSGFFHLTPRSQLPKHSHLRFHTSAAHDMEQKTLSFVDTRRFGSWKISSGWSPDRGPDPVFEYELFRKNVINNLDKAVFNKPICEVLLNQAYFNGIGNYLRAEILYRAKIMPFSEARSILENLSEEVKHEFPDLLKLCHDVPLEAMNLEGTNIYDPNATKDDILPFMKWLQCYENASMNKIQDHNKRAIWFSGKPGPLVPRTSGNKRHRKSKPVKQETVPLVKDDEDNKRAARRKKEVKDKQSIGEENQHTVLTEMPRTRSRTKKQ